MQIVTWLYLGALVGFLLLLPGIFRVIFAGACILVGLTTVAIALFGGSRMPDTPRRLHAASKAVALGVVAILVSSISSWDAALIGRALITVAFLILTTPISAHAIGRAAAQRTQARNSPRPMAMNKNG